jgi:pyruvate dehydrogenase E1 component beta subunit
MAVKPGGYAILEAVQFEMRANPHLWMTWQSRKPVEVSPTGQVIDLGAEFGSPRIPWGTAIDEVWYTGAVAGAAMSGVPGIAVLPTMASIRTFELVFNQIGKLRHMTGGQANMPLVMWVQMAGRGAGSAGQHADAGQETYYGAAPGLKVVIPSNPYDAKGLMHAAIRDPDPVIFAHYGSNINNVQIDVPDGDYVVPIGKAAVRQEGKDITLVGFGPAAVEINKAAAELAKAGVSVEVIDPISLKPLDTATIVASAKKTGRMLAVDHGPQTLSAVTEVIAQAAMGAPGTKFARLAFPDAPPPGSRILIEWMTPNAPKIVDAAKKLLQA